jgi:WD40 repeat protein
VSDARPGGCAFRGEVPAWTTPDGGVVVGDIVLPASDKPDRAEGGTSLGRSIFNPAATHLVAHGGLDRAFVWDLAQPRPREVAFPGEEFRVLDIAPDGRSFYACSNFGPVRRFDTASLALVQEIALGSLRCEALAASPNGRYLAVGGPPGDIVVFTAVDGAPVKSLHTGVAVESMRFGPESQTLSATEGGRVHLFDCDACLDLADLAALARARVTRPLSPDERAVHLGAASLLAQLRSLLP